MPRVALLHYSYPPLIGGVETILKAHARLLAEAGCEVSVFCGAGESDAHAQVRVVPMLAPDHPLRMGLEAELSRGAPGVAFAELQRQLATLFTVEFRAFDAVIAHNILTMPFHLAATAAFWAWTESRPGPQIVHWIHDLAVENPDYPHAQRPDFPWSLLRAAGGGIRHVAVSVERARRFTDLTGAVVEVVPNGIDPTEVLGLTPAVAALLGQAGWPGRWPLLFHPARVLRRKNLEWSLRATAALREAGETPSLIFSGAPDPHAPVAAATYGTELRALIRSLGLEQVVYFAADHFRVSNADLTSLYAAADAVLFPSRQEGFGLPVLEAALHRVPLVCAQVPALSDLPEASALLLAPDASGPEAAALIRQALTSDPASSRRRQTLRRFSWNGTIRDQLLEIVGLPQPSRQNTP